MNKTSIEWTDMSWNPITGCLHECDYCYARSMARRFQWTPGARTFKPEFHPKRLVQPSRKRKPQKIFVCSMADLLGEWVPREWISDIIQVMRDCPEHTFQILTKNPERIKAFDWPENVWVGGSAVDQVMYDRAMDVLADLDHVTYVSVEPMLGPVRMNGFSPDWVIIGAQSGPGGKQPETKWVEDLSRDTRTKGAALFYKPNLIWDNPPREFPR